MFVPAGDIKGAERDDQQGKAKADDTCQKCAVLEMFIGITSSSDPVNVFDH